MLRAQLHTQQNSPLSSRTTTATTTHSTVYSGQLYWLQSRRDTTQMKPQRTLTPARTSSLEYTIYQRASRDVTKSPPLFRCGHQREYNIIGRVSRGAACLPI